MQEIARFGIVNRQTEEQIRDAVFKTIQDLEIPAKREEIKVTATTAKVTIVVDYTVPVDILMYHVDLHFTPSSENKSLT
jgi:predicted AlkP superfamily phosphohydrolase/phosphomutase